MLLYQVVPGGFYLWPSERETRVSEVVLAVVEGKVKMVDIIQILHEIFIIILILDLI